MSGVEAVGLALAVLPLIISGLEHYEDVSTKFTSIRRYRFEVRSVNRKLRIEAGIFRNTLEKLLTRCVDDSVRIRLLDRIGKEEWADKNVERALERELGPSYDAFVETALAMEASVTELKDKLQIGPDGKSALLDRNTMQEIGARLKFTFQKAAYMELIHEIHVDNNRLDKLTEQASSWSSTHTSRRGVPDFDKARSQVSSVFRSLQKGFHRSCTAPHKVSLYMSDTSGPGDQNTTKVANKAESQTFRIVLHHDVTLSACASLPWLLKEAELHVMEHSPIITVPAVQNNTHSSNSHKKRSVRFQDPSDLAGPMQSLSMQPKHHQQQHQQQNPQHQQHQERQNLKEIIDLCGSIDQFRSIGYGICLGYLVDSANRSRHAMYWPSKPLVDANPFVALSLGSILSSSRSTRRLKVRESRELAVCIASSMLRLHDTPWLTESWSKGDITVFEQNGKLLAGHPFISANLQPTATAVGALPGGTSRAAYRVPIRNKTLFALGIMLIELCMGRPLDELREAQDLNDSARPELSDYSTAVRLLEDNEIFDTAGERYDDVVRRCICCTFDHKTARLEDVTFRRAVYENVVAVLKEDVSDIFSLQ